MDGQEHILNHVLDAVFGAVFAPCDRGNERHDLAQQPVIGGAISVLGPRHQLRPALFVVGFHVTFDTMHVPGLLGMPRRIYTYEPGRGWDTLNLVVSIGALIQGIAILVFVANLILSYWRGARAGKDPWDAWTLEWSISSPPPAYNFAAIPTVASRRPLWDLKHPEDPDSRYE